MDSKYQNYRLYDKNRNHVMKIGFCTDFIKLLTLHFHKIKKSNWYTIIKKEIYPYNFKVDKNVRKEIFFIMVRNINMLSGSLQGHNFQTQLYTFLGCCQFHFFSIRFCSFHENTTERSEFPLKVKVFLSKCNFEVARAGQWWSEKLARTSAAEPLPASLRPARFRGSDYWGDRQRPVPRQKQLPRCKINSKQPVTGRHCPLLLFGSRGIVFYAPNGKVRYLFRGCKKPQFYIFSFPSPQVVVGNYAIPTWTTLLDYTFTLAFRWDSRPHFHNM